MDAFWGCKWCRGRGCNQCQIESDKEYKRQFPNGPTCFSVKTDGTDPIGMEILKKHFSAENIGKVYKEGGIYAVGGLVEKAIQERESPTPPQSEPVK